MLYFPKLPAKTATNKPARWIRRSGELSRLLAGAGYNPANKFFTVRQLRIIYDFPGEP